jgi:hypothetical protein
MDAWRGNLVHRAIETYVVPALQARQRVSWDQVIEEARRLGARQFEFSARQRFREKEMKKSKAGDEYCALFEHEFEPPPTPEKLNSTLDSVEHSLRNLARLEDFLKHVAGRSFYRAEASISADYNGVRIQGVIDLVFSGAYDNDDIVEETNAAGATVARYNPRASS